MSHLENFICEYLLWKRFLLRRNEKVGALKHGGHSGELDIIAFNPKSRTLLHIEPSLDALTWERREARYAKKFATGRSHIRSLFDWVRPFPQVRQIAVLPSASDARRMLGKAEVITVDEVITEICEAVCQHKNGKLTRTAQSAISEQYPLLRTAQLCTVGYGRRLHETRFRLIKQEASAAV